MADHEPVGGQSAAAQPGSQAWRKRVAVLVAISLAAAGLILLEHNQSAAASSAPAVVHRMASPAVPADPQVAELLAVTSQLRGAASLMTQTLPGLDAPSAARTAAAASSANQAAGLSQRLVALAAAKRPDPTQASLTATQLQAALAATEAQAAAANAAPVRAAAIPFCNFTIQIGPFFIRVGQRVVKIGPFFIRFRAPCFLSGRIPTHIP